MQGQDSKTSYVLTGGVTQWPELETEKIHSRLKARNMSLNGHQDEHVKLNP